MQAVARQKRSSSVLAQNYRGRFAPSPSGPLHFGSLIAALASFLDARKNKGKWFVRIEDIDPPREQKGAATHILNTLELFGLTWDGEVRYQSQHAHYYQEIVEQLIQQHRCYACQCSRQQIKQSGGFYLGTCRQLNLPYLNNAIRFKNDLSEHYFSDIILGDIDCSSTFANEDFILIRKDGLFAYQLAVVLDDIAQNISHVIRGADLLKPTIRQINFFKQLNHRPPIYGHVPVALTAQGYKLSKQNKAPALNQKHPQQELFQALQFLGQQPPEVIKHETVENILNWAVKHWSLNKIPTHQHAIKLTQFL